MQRRTLIQAIIAGAAMLALAACQMPAMNREVDQAARTFYTDLHDGHPLPGSNVVAGDLSSVATLQELQANARAMMPAGPPVSVRLQGQNFRTDTTGGHADLTHAYSYTDRTLIVQTVFDRPPGAPAWRIIGFHVQTQMANGGAFAPPPNPASGPPAPAAAPAPAGPSDGAATAETPPAAADTQAPAEEGAAEGESGEVAAEGADK